jgi:anti-sigma factor (TIGR02949 family)
MTNLKDTKKYNCDDVERLAQAYLDGFLSNKEATLFEEHLDYCLPCDKKIEFEKRVKNIIREKAKEQITPDKLKDELKKIINKNKIS